MSRLLFSCVIAASATTSQLVHAQTREAPQMTEAKITASATIEVPGADAVEMNAAVVFSGDYAVAAVTDDPTGDRVNFQDGTVFNLSRPSYFHSAQKAWIDLNACKEWERVSIARTKQSLNNAPEEIRSAVQEMIEPNFDVQELPNGDLSIANSRLKYVVTPDNTVSKEMLKKYYDYDQLNAYHKAMTEKGFPPTPQLAVDAILAKRGLFPKVIAATVWSPNGDVKIDATTSIDALAADEKAQAEIAIQKANSK